MRIVLMGPPGAGKGTQAERLVKEFGMKHLSSGDIFRAEKASNSELGLRLARYMDAGELVPDDVVVEMMAKAVTQVDGGLMLDGFPRTVAQGEALDKQLAEAASPLDAVVVITADDDIIVKRIAGRRACPLCGRGYHVTFMPPRREGYCDDCDNAELTQRSDDCEATVRQRLEAYRAQTEAVIGYYKGCDSLAIVEVDGNRPAEVVADEVTQALASLDAARV
ncbi:MAG: adenylate kinase [Phycisphaerae bacterium]|nr:adenylate kinase [Planctomycetota bacterium]MBL7218844.1 adenylate kinase [Phycisphaerae bacterium]